MICPYCGTHRQLSAAMVGKIMSIGTLGGKCPGCHKHYEITRETMFDGDPESEPVACTRCGRPAERGITLCAKCHCVVVTRNNLYKQRDAVDRERTKRKTHKPKETIDEIAVKAQRMGLTYGKYVMLRELGKIKED